jgi:thymidylate synthase (FAD)
VNIFARNFGYAVKHPVRTWRVRKACKAHVKREPFCQWCSTLDSPQAHHVIPMWKDESIASDPANFITLCKKCHLPLGHNRSFATKYVENVREICDARKVVRRERE